MKTKKTIHLLMAALLALTVASCGSDNKSGGTSSSSSSTVTNSAADASTMNTNEGVVKMATSVADFRELVRLGHFAKIQAYCVNPSLSPILKYRMSKVTCQLVTSSSDFLWWDDAFSTVKNKCTTNSSYEVVESRKNGTTTNGFGSTKQESVNKMLSLIDNADRVTFANYANSGYVLIVEEGSQVFQIDLRYPLAANPILIQDDSSTSSQTGTVYGGVSTKVTCE